MLNNTLNQYPEAYVLNVSIKVWAIWRCWEYVIKKLLLKFTEIIRWIISVQFTYVLCMHVYYNNNTKL